MLYKPQSSTELTSPELTSGCAGFLLLAWLVVSFPSGGFGAPPAAPPGPPIESVPAKSPAWLPGFQVRYPLRVPGDPAAFPSKSVMASLPTGGWLKPDGSDVAVQSASGQVIPLAVLSHDRKGETLVQFQRQANDRWYWAYAVNMGAVPPKAQPIAEGMTLELREWAGADLGSWAAVLAGLQKSEQVIGNAITADMNSNANLARPDNPVNCATSYRGFLNIKTPGIYRFFVNSDDAAFLFIDGFKVCERTGTNQRLVGRIPRKSIGADVDLKTGIHPIEVHHVVGNNALALGYCTLLWLPPAQNGWTFVPRDTFVPATYAEVAGVETIGGGQAACFGFGVDDALISGDVNLFLERFEAQGTIKDPSQLIWDLGDGTRATGTSVMHAYLTKGDYEVTLSSGPGLPAFRRRVRIWPAPTPSSPLSLAKAVEVLEATDWKRWDIQRLKQMFDFLLVCQQPERWPLLESVARHLLGQTALDATFRLQLHTSVLESMAEQGRGREALKLVEPAAQEFASVPSLQIGARLMAAEIYHRYLKEPAEASKLYQSIVETNRRLEHPSVRLAAIRLGDLYAETGDLVKAGEAYRLANSLGADPKTSAQTEAITRGALLRIAEQRLRSGDIKQCRQLLERIELDFPEQKMEGLYRFLRAEADRLAGKYEEAIRNYEFLLKLNQWAGFRDRALYGLADSYFRMGQYDKAMDWLGAVKESYPRYYARQKLQPYEKVIEGRLNRLKNSGANGNRALKTSPFVGFSGWQTGFEPEEKPLPGEFTNLRIVPGLGMRGPHVFAFEDLPVARVGSAILKIPLKDITSDGYYWVEFWYRGTVMGSHIPHLLVPVVQVMLYGNGTEFNADGGNTGNMYMERGHGQWRKFACKMRAPVTQDGRIDIYLYYGIGTIDIDRFSILPISDRRNDLYNTFVEGPYKP